MTSQTRIHRHRSVKVAVVGAVTAGLLAGFGSSATPTTAAASDSGVPQFKSADELLAFIDDQYDMGAGGGQLSNLIKQVMKYRAAGFKPSKANVAEIVQALNYRPNQKPLIDALNDTRNLEQAIRSVKKYGAHAQGTICYTFSPVHTVEKFVQIAREQESMGADSLCIKDMAGILSPAAAEELVYTLRRLDARADGAEMGGEGAVGFQEITEQPQRCHPNRGGLVVRQRDDGGPADYGHLPILCA